MKILFGLLVLFCNTNIYQVFGQKTFSQRCDQFQPSELSNFDKNRYMGFWYIQVVFDYADIKGRDCLSSNCTSTGPRTAKIVEKGKNAKTGIWSTINSSMLFDDVKKGNYKYQIPDQNVSNWPIEILHTDYTTYSVEFSCIPNPSSRGLADVFMWIMSRTRIVDSFFWDKVGAFLRKHDLYVT